VRVVSTFGGNTPQYVPTFVVKATIQCNKFNSLSFFSYNIKAKQYELYLWLGNIESVK